VPTTTLEGVLFYLGRKVEAQEMFERSIRAEPNYGAYSNLGTIHFSEGRFPEAARLFRQALEINSSQYQVVINLASAYKWSGQRAEAQESYEKAILMVKERLEVNPKDPGLMASLGQLYAATSRVELARGQVQEALSAAPDDLEVMALAAEAYELLGERDRAMHWILKAVEAGYPADAVRENPTFRQLVADQRFQG
jgi:tetratricopeptide (TPR) repeat protein